MADVDVMTGRSSAERKLTLVTTIIASSLFEFFGAARNPFTPTAADFHQQLFAPIRGLLHGIDVFSPTADYVHHYAISSPASLHPPSSWLIGAPFVALPLHAGYLAWVAFSIACLWGAILIIAEPWIPERQALVLLLGVLIVCGGPADYLFALGQLTGPAALGFALVARFPHRVEGAIGLTMLATIPQTAVPLSVLLVFAGARSTVLRAWIGTLVLSLPFGILALVNAGSHILTSLANSARMSADVPIALDIVRVDWRLPGLEIALATTALVFLCVAARREGPSARLLAACVALMTGLVYHLMYDLVVVSVALLPVALAHSRRIALLPTGMFMMLRPELLILTAGLVGVEAMDVWHVLKIVVAAIVALAGICSASALTRAEPRRSVLMPGGGRTAGMHPCQQKALIDSTPT